MTALEVSQRVIDAWNRHDADAVTAQNNQATICKPWKSLMAVAFGLFLSVPGLTRAQNNFTTIYVPGATRTAANGNSTHEIAGEFDDALARTGPSLKLLDRPGSIE
jgi:hypothetical protein